MTETIAFYMTTAAIGTIIGCILASLGITFVAAAVIARNIS